MDILKYPFDAQLILRTKKKIRRELLADKSTRIQKKIAILGGSTTSEIRDMLDLFLLDQGIEAEFYESDYNNYWQDVMFDDPKLIRFQPDIIFIHTTSRNLTNLPELTDKSDIIQRKLNEVFETLRMMWDKIAETYHCTVIQNNYERPWYRLLGNRDIFDEHGCSNFAAKLNEKLYEYARSHHNFYINDIDFLSASYGLQKWNDPYYWYMYKCVPALPAVPEFAFNLANIIKSIYGKNKKALVTDLDNTLWGGIIGEDGPENIEIGQETPVGQLYSEFQAYIKAHKAFGTLLAVDSKNDMEGALAGLNRPDSILKPEDFLIIKANWEPKDKNIREIAQELNIGTDAIVFLDDNPAERHIVHVQVPDASVPEIGQPQDYLTTLDRSGFFEMTNFTEDDIQRSEMYKANIRRIHQEAAFTNYQDYLLSLEMQAEIKSFSALYLPRIAQLTNKSNQFNLTTKRYTEAELTDMAEDPNCITLYGKLSDKFGDNGLVTVVCGHVDENVLHIDLWLMSCRVLKRDMEYAMMDELVKCCQRNGIDTIRGYYYPTKKNKMVSDFYGQMGFTKINEDNEGNSIWELKHLEEYRPKNSVIEVRKS